MELEIAKRIVKAGEDMGLDISLREDYSGRGMYGKKTTGIITDQFGNIIQATAAAAVDLQKENDYFESLTEDQQQNPPMAVEYFLDNLDFAKDNMGYDLIIY